MLSHHAIGRRISGCICRKILRVLWLLILIALPVRSQPDTVPFHKGPDHRILVSVLVDGKARQFILDTGAKDTILSENAVPAGERAGLRLQEQIVGFRGMAIIRAAELRLGKHVWVSQPVHVTDLTEVSKSLGVRVEGILGMDVLSQFKSIQIRFNSSTIEMEK